jgi:hypothetical protein
LAKENSLEVPRWANTPGIFEAINRLDIIQQFNKDAFEFYTLNVIMKYSYILYSAQKISRLMELLFLVFAKIRIDDVE